VMNAYDHRAAAVESLHQMELPQWPLRIERFAHQLARQRLKFLLAGSAPERDASNMRCQIEVLVGLPVRAHGRPNDSLAKARKLEESLCEQALEPHERDALAQD